MVEPAGTDRGIDFGRIPYQLLLALNDAPAAEILFARFIAARKLPVIGLLRLFLDRFILTQRRRNDAPLRLPAMPRFIPAPANVRSAYRDGGIRLQFPNQGVVRLPIVFLTLAIRTFAAGAVKPDAEYLAVAGQELS